MTRTNFLRIRHLAAGVALGVVVQIVGNGPTATRFFAPPEAPKN